VFPVTAALIWSTAQRIAVYDIPFWPIADFASHAAGWLVILSVSALMAGVATTIRRQCLAGCSCSPRA
jgi:hypothetical protein